MATCPPRSPLIAVDTNVPLDPANRKERVRDALDVIKLKAFDVEMPVIATPVEIVAKFF